MRFSGKTLRGSGKRWLAAATIVGCAFATAGAFGSSTVGVQAIDFEYYPYTIHVMPGDTVRWQFFTGGSHTVTSGSATSCNANGMFNGFINAGNPIFSYTVPASAAPGTIYYFCVPHCSSQMRGEIIIRRLGDITLDGVIDAADLGALLGAWGGCRTPNSCPADLNNDGTVGAADLGILLGNWGG